jgi:hypothetical protein
MVYPIYKLKIKLLIKIYHDSFATIKSSLPFESIVSVYGLFKTLFKSSCKESSSQDKNSDESC